MIHKKDSAQYQTILQREGIHTLYHFTDRDNLLSIIQNGGLFSWKDCDDKQITISKPGGGTTSRSLDVRDNLEHYVRVSFTKEHPMMYVAMNDGRISNPVILEIDPEVIVWADSKYADRNATKTGALIGDDLKAFERIHFSAVKKRNHFDLPSEEQMFFQAEVLVKHCIPLSAIKNISNFGVPISTPNAPLQLQSKTPYTAQITRNTPTAIIFMVDQSGSMSHNTCLHGETLQMSEAVSRLVNKQINELVCRCIKGSDVRHYYDIAIIGYGSQVYSGWQGNLSGRYFVSPQEIKDNPYKRIMTREEVHTRRGVSYKEIESVQWMEARHDGGSTNMYHAYLKAQELLETWMEDHKNQDCYPPTIINITDGAFNDCNEETMLQTTNEIKSLFSNDGNVLLFNIHITPNNEQPIIFPINDSELSSNRYGRILYKMSSLLPMRYNKEIASLRCDNDDTLRHSAMAVNADMSALIKLLDIGTPTQI